MHKHNVYIIYKLCMQMFLSNPQKQNQKMYLIILWILLNWEWRLNSFSNFFTKPIIWQYDLHLSIKDSLVSTKT